jgi:ribulose-5-phosphate 4-epimerase/fuculose-1-phosphate aldolase
MVDLGELKERVAQACRVLGRLDLTKAATGHASVRVPGTDRVLIRARGPGELGVRFTTSEQVIEVNLEGQLMQDNDEGLDVPIEIFIHTALYRARPEVNAVVHVHPPMVVLFTICDRPLLPIYGAYDPAGASMAINGIPTYGRSILISSPSLGDDLAQAMGGSPICMMRGHGITSAAPSIEEAALQAIQLNELATMNYQAHLLGGAQPIPVEDQAIFGKMRRAPAADGQPSGRAMALWRYYTALTDS